MKKPKDKITIERMKPGEIIRYDIARGVSHQDLMRNVQEDIEDGFVPTGGVCCNADGEFFQALVKVWKG